MADKELARIRGRFVEKISGAVLKQLLDDLLDDGILNDGEKDSIIEENSSRADKARHLIDVVRKKGDGASRNLITHLQDRDPVLFSELVTVSQEEQQQSLMLIPSAEAAWIIRYCANVKAILENGEVQS